MQVRIGVVKRLQVELPRLNKAERRVADVVLDDPPRALAMSIAELAAAASASEPTVMRLVRKVGCTGFSDFKLCLSQDIAVSQMFVFSEDDAPPRAPSEMAEKVYNSMSQALSQSFAQLDSEALAAAGDAILSASRVFCFGLGGSSANMANEAVTRLFRYDIRVSASADAYHQRMVAGLCDEHDVLLILSVTGKPPPLVGTAEVARGMDATVISITRPNSPLAHASSIVIPLDLPDHQKHLQIPHRTRYGQLFVLDCLATYVATARLDGSAAKLRRLRALLIQMNGPTDEQPVGD